MDITKEDKYGIAIYKETIKEEKEAVRMKNNNVIIPFSLKKNTLILNLNEAYKIQRSIKDKYIEKIKHLSIYEQFERYINMIMEEINEVYEEVLKLDSNESQVEETIDVVMYILSTLALLEPISEYYGTVKLKSSIIINIDNNRDHAIELLSINNDLINIKKLCSERKWHKPTDPDNTLITNVRYVIDGLYCVLYSVISIIPFGYELDNYVYLLNRKLKFKEDYILNL